jgi:hypothetical protein
MTTYDDRPAPLRALSYSLAPPDAPRARTVARWRRERFFAAMLLVPRRVSSRAARWGAAACAAGARCFLLTLGVCVLASLLPCRPTLWRPWSTTLAGRSRRRSTFGARFPQRSPPAPPARSGRAWARERCANWRWSRRKPAPLALISAAMMDVQGRVRHDGPAAGQHVDADAALGAAASLPPSPGHRRRPPSRD